MTFFGSVHVNVARVAVDTLVNFGNLDIRVITLDVLPGATYLTVNSIAIILIVSTDAFYLLLIEVAVLRREQSVD